MFLDKKKGDIVTEFVVLIIVAVILIFVVTSFGAKIWSSFFPDEDKSTLKSFEVLFSIVEAKSVSPLQYDSTMVNLYLADDYNIAFFTDGKANCREKHWYGPTVTIYNAPSDCETGKQCLCLYDDTPEIALSKKDKHVVKCQSITNVMKIDKEHFFLNDRICGSPEAYSSYIVAKRNVAGSSYLYMIPDNDSNRKLDENWSIPMCTNNANSLCYGEGDGAIVTFNDDTHMELLYNYCKTQQNVLSTSIRCIYNKGTTGADDRGCDIDCKYGEASSENIKSCNEFNKAYFGKTKYLSKDWSYKYYYMCSNSIKYYTNMKCKLNQWSAYICKNSVDGAENSKCHPPTTVDCKLEYIDPDVLVGTGQFITLYDTANPDCKKYMDTNYYPGKSTIWACKSDIVGCEAFVMNKKVDCSLKYLSDSNRIYWITYYDAKIPDCDSQIKNLFEIAYFCTTA